MGSQASGFQHSFMLHLPLIFHWRSRLHLLKGKKWVFEAARSPLLGGFELYLRVHVHVRMLHSAGNLGQEQLGCMSGPSLCWETRPELEGPQQRCPGPAVSLALRCLLARALVGTEWPLAHGCS